MAPPHNDESDDGLMSSVLLLLATFFPGCKRKGLSLAAEFSIQISNKEKKLKMKKKRKPAQFCHIMNE